MNRSIVRLTALQLAAVLGETSCLTARGSAPQSFTIEAPAPNPRSNDGGVVVAMAGVEVAPQFAGEAFVYQTAEHEFVRDPYARFAALPSSLLSVAIRGYLANADFISDVVSVGSELRPRVTLECEAVKLAGALRSADSSSVLTLQFRVLLDPGEVGPAREILLKTYTSTTVNRRATARAVAGGWNQALAEVMNQFENDLRSSFVAAGLLRAGSSSPLASATPRPSNQ